MSPRAVAVNVGANTNEPGFRAPVFPDGSFAFVPIPEAEPTSEPVPTYGDIVPRLDVDLPVSRDEELRETPIHLDPAFAGYPLCERYTYGDPYPVKAGPLSDLAAGDFVFFYATLDVAGPADRLPPQWGAFVIGQFELARDPVTGEEWPTLPDSDRAAFAGNAHLQRETFDARVLLAGDPDGSTLYDRCVPLSQPSGGADANRLVTELSSDSGRGPWWRRPLRFDADATAELRAAIAAGRAAD